MGRGGMQRSALALGAYLNGGASNSKHDVGVLKYVGLFSQSGVFFSLPPQGPSRNTANICT